MSQASKSVEGISPQTVTTDQIKSMVAKDIGTVDRKIRQINLQRIVPTVKTIPPKNSSFNNALLTDRNGTVTHKLEKHLGIWYKIPLEKA